MRKVSVVLTVKLFVEPLLVNSSFVGSGGGRGGGGGGGAEGGGGGGAEGGGGRGGVGMPKKVIASPPSRPSKLMLSFNNPGVRELREILRVVAAIPVCCDLGAMAMTVSRGGVGQWRTTASAKGVDICGTLCGTIAAASGPTRVAPASPV